MSSREPYPVDRHGVAVALEASIILCFLHRISTKIADILRRGGNAADAALAMAASMHVLQPYGTGIGGDCFALHYDACSKKVRCVDGCGRSPAALTLELVESRSPQDWTRERYRYGLQATVPGAVKAWFYIASRFGSVQHVGSVSSGYPLR